MLRVIKLSAIMLSVLGPQLIIQIFIDYIECP